MNSGYIAGNNIQGHWVFQCWNGEGFCLARCTSPNLVFHTAPPNFFFHCLQSEGCARLLTAQECMDEKVMSNEWTKARSRWPQECLPARWRLNHGIWSDGAKGRQGVLEGHWATQLTLLFFFWMGLGDMRWDFYHFLLNVNLSQPLKPWDWLLQFFFGGTFRNATMQQLADAFRLMLPENFAIRDVAKNLLAMLAFLFRTLTTEYCREPDITSSLFYLESRWICAVPNSMKRFKWRIPSCCEIAMFLLASILSHFTLNSVQMVGVDASKLNF